MTYRSPLTGTKFEDIRREAQRSTTNVAQPDMRPDRRNADLHSAHDRGNDAQQPNQPVRRTLEA